MKESKLTIEPSSLTAKIISGATLTAILLCGGFWFTEKQKSLELDKVAGNSAVMTMHLRMEAHNANQTPMISDDLVDIYSIQKTLDENNMLDEGVVFYGEGSYTDGYCLVTLSADDSTGESAVIYDSKDGYVEFGSSSSNCSDGIVNTAMTIGWEIGSEKGVAIM